MKNFHNKTQRISTAAQWMSIGSISDRPATRSKCSSQPSTSTTTTNSFAKAQETRTAKAIENSKKEKQVKKEKNRTHTLQQQAGKRE